MEEVFADLHVHIGRSENGKPIKITAARSLNFANIAKECADRKGINIVGIIDCASPYVIEDIENFLKTGEAYEIEDGGIIYKDKVCILLGSEVETSEVGRNGKCGAAHNVCFFPHLSDIKGFSKEMSKHIHNITLSTQRSDVSGYELIDVVEKYNGILIPAHCFTPFKSYYGNCVDRMKDIFAAADDIIAERPQLLEKKTDDIFNILDDGTGNMTVTRWAVMTRALMRGLTSYAIDDIISFLADISDNSLICEFTGYVLQNEKDIDMLDLLMTAYAGGRAEKVLPFVIPCVSSGNECHAAEYITMVRLLNDIKNVGDRSRLVCEYAALIEKHCQEDVILSGYTEEYCSNTEMQQLVWQLGCALYKNRHDDAIKWTDMYVYSDDRSRQLMGADFIYRGLMYNTEYF